VTSSLQEKHITVFAHDVAASRLHVVDTESAVTTDVSCLHYENDNNSAYIARNIRLLKVTTETRGTRAARTSFVRLE